MGNSKGKVLRLSGTEFQIMRLLANNGGREMYGLELVAKSEGAVKKGTVYVLLDRLEDRGYVKSRKEQTEATIPKRMYRITGLGSQVLNAWTSVAEIGGLAGAAVA